MKSKCVQHDIGTFSKAAIDNNSNIKTSAIIFFALITIEIIIIWVSLIEARKLGKAACLKSLNNALMDLRTKINASESARTSLILIKLDKINIQFACVIICVSTTNWRCF